MFRAFVNTQNVANTQLLKAFLQFYAETCDDACTPTSDGFQSLCEFFFQRNMYYGTSAGSNSPLLTSHASPYVSRPVQNLRDTMQHPEFHRFAFTCLRAPTFV